MITKEGLLELRFDLQNLHYQEVYAKDVGDCCVIVDKDFDTVYITRDYCKHNDRNWVDLPIKTDIGVKNLINLLTNGE